MVAENTSTQLVWTRPHAHLRHHQQPPLVPNDGCHVFPVATGGVDRAIAWIKGNATGQILAAAEGARSYRSKSSVVQGPGNPIESTLRPFPKEIWAKTLPRCCNH